jgi:hypothetical protein
VRVRDLFGITAGYQTVSMSATDAISSLDLSQEHFVLRGEYYLPLMPMVNLDGTPGWRRELIVGAAIYANSVLLDDWGDGFRDGTGFGLEVAFCSNEWWWVGHLMGRTTGTLGLGYRSIACKTLEISGLGSSINDTLNAFYLTMNLEIWF